MGGGMAGRLLSAGFPLAVYNRTKDKSAPLPARVRPWPARRAKPRPARTSSLAWLRTISASRGVWLGENGALAGARRGAVLIECSTLTVGWMKELAAAAAKQGCELLDAPVTGTKPHAASGELSFLIGGSDAALATAQPVLSVLGREFIHLGPTGSGALHEADQQFHVRRAGCLSCGSRIYDRRRRPGLCEKSLPILTHGAPGSGLVQRAAARAFANDFTPNFPLHLMAKDLGYAIDRGFYSLDTSFRPRVRRSRYSRKRLPKAMAIRIFPR